MTSWLPPIVPLDAFGGDWNDYLEALYKIFENDFIANRPVFRGRRLGLKRIPVYEGKVGTFWHFISDGKDESKRIPDLRRCERVPYPAPIINNSTAGEVRCWKKKHNGENRVILWLPDDNYVVVLAERKGYLLPWTAYLVTYENSRKKLQKEFEQQKAGSTPL